MYRAAKLPPCRCAKTKIFLRAIRAFVAVVSSECNNCKMSEGKKNTKKAASTSSPTKKSQYQLYQELEKNVDVGKT